MLSRVKNHRINKNTHYNQQRTNTYIQVSGIKQDHKKTTQSKRYRARYEKHIEKETKDRVYVWTLCLLRSFRQKRQWIVTKDWGKKLKMILKTVFET